MSISRHSRPDPERRLLVRTYAVTHPPSLAIPEGAFDWHQLAHASRGVMSVHTASGTWVVPPHRAVWIPAGVPHRIEMSGRVSVRTLFFTSRVDRTLPGECVAVNVSPLLRELILQPWGSACCGRTSPRRGVWRE